MRLAPKLAVCIPSRGLVYSKTIEAVLRETKDCDWRLFMTHDLPIPDCFNSLVDQALDWGAEYLWFVEEDMLLPQGILNLLMIEMIGHKIAVADYPVPGGSHTVIRHDKLTQYGTGCLLVERSVFDTLGKPYFRSRAYNLETFDELPEAYAKHAYGLHDIDFSYRTQQLKFFPAIIPMRAGQYRILEKGNAQSNNGAHTIEELVFEDSD